MAQYDVIVNQNVATSGEQYIQRTVTGGKGRLFTFDSGNIPATLPVGTDGYVLTADSAEATGLKWAVASGGASDVFKTWTLQSDSGYTWGTSDVVASGDDTMDLVAGSGIAIDSDSTLKAFRIRTTGSGGLTSAYVSMTDGTTTASASGGDTFKFRSADNKLTVAVTDNDATHGDNLLITVNEANINHDNLAGFDANEHFLQSAISISASQVSDFDTEVANNSAVVANTAKVTMTYPGAGIALSTGSAWDTSITNNSANWNTAFSWGDHDGLYDPVGSASSAVSTHESTFNHTNYNTAYSHSQIITGNPHDISWSDLSGIQPAPANHDLLGSSHDAVAADPLRGALIVGNENPLWTRLSLGTDGTVLRSDGTDAYWGTLSYSDITGTPPGGDVSWGTATNEYIVVGSASNDIQSFPTLSYDSSTYEITINPATTVGGKIDLQYNSVSTLQLQALNSESGTITSPNVLQLYTTNLTGGRMALGNGNQVGYWLTISDPNTTANSALVQMINSAVNQIAVFNNDGTILFPELGSDDTEDHVVAINDTTGLLTKRAVSSFGSSNVTVANQADNRIITATGTTDALNAEANLTYDGTTLLVTQSADDAAIQITAFDDSSDTSLYIRHTGFLWQLESVGGSTGERELQLGFPQVYFTGGFWVPTITLGYVGDAEITTHGTDEDLLIDPNGTGDVIVNATIRAVDGTIGSIDGEDLILKSGLVYDSLGAAAGNVKIQAGDARLGDNTSAPGVIYLIPGLTDDGFGGTIGIGDTSQSVNEYRIETVSGQANTGLSITTKGNQGVSINSYNHTGQQRVGGFEFVQYSGANNWEIRRSNANIDTLRINAGNSGTVAGWEAADLILKGGDGANAAGFYDGGDVYIYPGQLAGAGADGNIYLGIPGGSGELPARGSETNIVYYDTTTGKLSYGTVSAGGGGDVSWGTATSKYIVFGSSPGDIESESQFYFDSSNRKIVIENGTQDSNFGINRTYLQPGGGTRTDLYPTVADGASALAYLFDTVNNLSTTGAEIAAFRNQGTDVLTIDKDGNVNIPSGAEYRINGTAIGSNVTVANQANNRIITATGTTDELNAEEDLLFTGTQFSVVGIADPGDVFYATSAEIGISDSSFNRFKINPSANDGVDTFYLNTISHTTGVIINVRNNNTQIFSVDPSGNVNIPSGAEYRVNGVAVVDTNYWTDASGYLIPNDSGDSVRLDGTTGAGFYVTTAYTTGMSAAGTTGSELRFHANNVNVAQIFSGFAQWNVPLRISNGSGSIEFVSGAEIRTSDSASSPTQDLTIRTGDATDAGGDDSGDIFIYPGDSTAGTRGDVYLGDGTAGGLKAKGSETNVVYYDTATGKLSYGTAGGGSLWTEDTNGITYTAGNVGIGVASNATYDLRVAGTVYFDSKLLVSGGGDNFQLYAGSTADHVYMEFFADSAAQTTRSGYFGFPSAGATQMILRNQMAGGTLQLQSEGEVIMQPGTSSVSRIRYGSSDRIVATSAGVEISGILDIERIGQSLSLKSGAASSSSYMGFYKGVLNDGTTTDPTNTTRNAYFGFASGANTDLNLYNEIANSNTMIRGGSGTGSVRLYSGSTLMQYSLQAAHYWYISGTAELVLDNNTLYPNTDNGLSLGTSDKYWNNLYATATYTDSLTFGITATIKPVDLGGSGHDLTIIAGLSSTAPGGDLFLKGGTSGGTTLGGAVEIEGGTGYDGGDVFIRGYPGNSTGQVIIGSDKDGNLNGSSTATPVLSVQASGATYMAIQGSTTSSDAAIALKQSTTVVGVMGWDDSSNGVKISVGTAFNTTTGFTVSSSTITFYDQIRVATGTTTTPGICFGTSDTNTGFYRYGVDDIGVTCNGDLEFLFLSGGTFHAEADIIAYSTTVSDERLKKNIETIGNARKILMAMNPVSFNWKYREEGVDHYGFIAQEIEEILPSMVRETPLPLHSLRRIRRLSLSISVPWR
jgi:hypothetical protein